VVTDLDPESFKTSDMVENARCAIIVYQIFVGIYLKAADHCLYEQN